MYITSCPYFVIVSTDISSTTWGTPEEDPVPYRGWWRWRWPSPDHYTVQCPGQVCVGSGINLYVMWRISWECYFTKEKSAIISLCSNNFYQKMKHSIWFETNGCWCDVHWLYVFFYPQDVCKSCGSFGRGEEGKLIVCTQCGQCYHPYCASVKVRAHSGGWLSGTKEYSLLGFVKHQQKK